MKKGSRGRARSRDSAKKIDMRNEKSIKKHIKSIKNKLITAMTENQALKAQVEICQD